ncbi:GNAT family N-acetyltransferase [Xenorhabdus szentirmaii]|uniref:Acetyltransferase (GNAT-family protein) n=1 Tax=Xenorhabdus szentirmaii DSM 16338 TaxID=1427518 RepID=W1IRB8_9GAMM|nr:GNAT family N-acetyltransferase [Xenorhabdus szentirmaii]PHM30553.1 GCN5 family acetyltransferase [Xenorhabdus szentirmaii DSM 16338]CDL81017.1 putative acetyltransferase (GNAT-family protein) [Xenorhabdus szentirmaii DSM 16338]
MTDSSTLIISALDNSHDRASFHCGVPLLDEYIRKQAKQDVTRRISRVFVAINVTEPNKIIGYYTLSALSVEFSELPPSLAKKLPRRAVPAALLGRLAVNQTTQQGGVGRMLLADAIKRTLAITDIAIYAMIVDAIEGAQKFYEQYGFIPLTTGKNRLFLPMKSI